MSFSVASDLFNQRYGMFALCMLKLIVADTINYKFCSCKVFKELSWNKLEAVKSALTVYGPVMHETSVFQTVYQLHLMQSNPKIITQTCIFIGQIWLLCDIILCIFSSSWLVAFSWWNSWDWTAERDWRGGFPSADKQDLCLGNWRLRACLSENYNSHSMRALLKPLCGSEGLAAVTHPMPVIVDIGLGHPSFFNVILDFLLERTPGSF